MKPMASQRNTRGHGERGAILAFTGMALLTLVGMTVVGVDLGRLAFTATEVQAVAEVGATGYAHAWLAGVAAGGDPGDGPCAADALKVVRGNFIDAQRASNGNVEGYERGFYDADTRGPFTTAVPAGETANAVRATATATVDNFFAGLFAAPQSTVRKTAVAVVTCGDRARPLPLVVQDCSFGGFDGPEDCPELRTLTQQSVLEENTCWTNLSSSGSADTNDIRTMIEAQCCPGGPGNCVLPPDYPLVSEGQSIQVLNGQSMLLKAMQVCWDNGFRNFLVPVTPCGAPCNQSNVVSSFANITLTARPQAQGNPKFLALESFCSANPEIEGWGGTCSGAYKVAMVE